MAWKYKTEDLPEEIILSDISEQSYSDLSTGFSFEEKTHRYEKELIVKALSYCKNKRVKTAGFLGITRDKLNYLLKKHGIN